MPSTIYPLGVCARWSAPHHACNSLHRCGTHDRAWPSSTPSSSRSRATRRPGSSWRGGSTGRSASSGTPPTSRSTGCWPDGGRRLGVASRPSPRPGGPTRRCTPSTAGRRAGAGRLAGRRPTPIEPLRSELAVKLRGASYGDRAAVLDVVRAQPAPSTATRLAHYEQLERARLPRPDGPDRPRARPVPRPARRHPPGASSGSSGSPSTWTPTQDRPHDVPPPARADHASATSTLRNRVVMGSMHTGLEDTRARPARSSRRTSPSGPAAASA